MKDTTQIFLNDPSSDSTLETEKSRIEEAVTEPPLAFLRKGVGWFCVIVWGFSVFSLLFGFADVRFIFPVILMLGLLALLNIPVFLHKKKFYDVVIAIIAGVLCFCAGIGLIVMNQH